MANSGTIYLIPTFLAEGTTQDKIPAEVGAVVSKLHYFIVENARTARRYIKEVDRSKVIEELSIAVIDKNSTSEEVKKALKPVIEGHDAGIISEAGCPGIADPGAEVVRLAHKYNIKVVPLVGPSSILLALMSSGFNGQSFAFHGYLPIEKKDRITTIKNLEKEMLQKDRTQIFMETPYRNMKMLEDLVLHLSPETLLCVAANINADDEFIKTEKIANWKKKLPDINKKPAIFLIYKS